MTRKKLMCFALSGILLASSAAYATSSQATTKVKLNKTSIQLYVKESKQLKLKNYKKKVRWVSKNKAIATVSKSGLVKAKKVGNTIIIAKAKNGKTYKCKVRVIKTAATCSPTPTLVPSNATLQPSSTPLPTMEVLPTATPTDAPATKSSVSSGSSVIMSRTDGINSLNFDMLSHFGKKNSFFSAYSVDISLSMLANGTSGNTQNEILNLLHVGSTETQNNALKDLRAELLKSDDTFTVANSIWLDDELNYAANVEADFFEPLKKYYNTDKTVTDLASTKAIDAINRWVDENTKHIIPKLLMAPLDTDTRMVLINAVAFEREWKYQFNQFYTANREFYTSTGKVEIETMKLMDKHFKYNTQNGMQCIELPYKDSAIAMDIFLSETKKDNTYDLFQKLSNDEKLKMFEKLGNASSTIVTPVHLPKFSYETPSNEMSIKKMLQTHGMKDAFSEYDADLTKTSKDLYVNDVIHKAKIEVMESGTRAAAVTAIKSSNCTAVTDEIKKPEFIADHPFIYALRDTKTGTILFMGYFDGAQ